MKVIAGPRASGKTTEAIKLANEEDAYLAVRTKKQANDIYHSDTYPDLERFPVTYREIQNKRAAGFNNKVVIDNMEAFIRECIGEVRVVGATTTAERMLEERE